MAAALTTLALPASASAQSCTAPKGWSTATAQFEYAMYREMGIATARVQRYIPPPGSTVDTAAFIRRLPQNALDIATGTVESGLYAAAAAVIFGADFATATVSEPPSCGSKKTKKK